MAPGGVLKEDHPQDRNYYEGEDGNEYEEEPSVYLRQTALRNVNAVSVFRPQGDYHRLLLQHHTGNAFQRLNGSKVHTGGVVHLVFDPRVRGFRVRQVGEAANACEDIRFGHVRWLVQPLDPTLSFLITNKKQRQFMVHHA